MAQRALKHCRMAPENHWRIATEAEAALMLGELDKALGLYGRAIKMAESQRDIESMYTQAVRVADRVFGRKGVKRFEELSGFPRAAERASDGPVEARDDRRDAVPSRTTPTREDASPG